MVFKAGYISDALSDIINKRFQNKDYFRRDSENLEVLQLKGLLDNLSSFEISFSKDQNIDFLDINPILAVQNNILTRGNPTLAPIIVEEVLESLKLVKRNIKEKYKFSYSSFSEDLGYNDIFEIMHIVYPGLEIRQQDYLGKLDSQLEWEFLEALDPIFKQLLQSQRSFESITKTHAGLGLKVDFSYSKPYKTIYNSKEYTTMVLEVDGPHHSLIEHVIYDELRDDLIKAVDSSVFRYNSQEISEENIDFEEYFYNELKEIYLKNYSKNIDDNLELYTLIFMPLNVARIQKCLIEVFIRNSNLLSQDGLNIAIIERDIPGGAIGFKVFKEFIENINNLVEGDQKLELPEMNVVIFQEDQWVLDDDINLGLPKKNILEFRTEDFDITIDSSVLMREGVYNFEKEDKSNHYTIRSAHFVDKGNIDSMVRYCASSLKYKILVNKEENTSYTNIESLYPKIRYFLNNIFRLTEFRDGQLPIISRALQKLPVIGLLPTGGGKSLTYQLSAFMQPTLVLVVDPIKALMEDQVRVLNEKWIDCVGYINSSQSSEEKNQNTVDFKLGLKQIIFVSPERLVIEDFRNVLSNINSTEKGQSIGYCVIDEVHCLSEWGHDFRYDYLMLGKNAQQYCYTRDKDDAGRNTTISLIGLTATATFDVLADIERELQIKDEDSANAIIMIENSIRPELFYRVVKVEPEDNRANVLIEEIKNFKNNYAYFNNDEILKKSQHHHFKHFDPLDFCVRDEFGKPEYRDGALSFSYNTSMRNHEFVDKQNSIVFCAVKGTKQNEIGEFVNQKGVRYIHSELVNKKFNAVYYHGSGDENEFNDKVIQENFNSFLNGKSNLMVCTKAFGMGIDKEDIVSTYHINYSSSLESLVQECGRAGRNRKASLSTIFACSADYYEFDYINLPRYYHGLNSFHMWIIRQNLSKLKYRSKEEFLEHLETTDFSATTQAGVKHSLSEFQIRNLRQRIPENQDKLLLKKSFDRDIHDYFFNLTYKGVEYEKVQISNFFDYQEKTILNQIEFRDLFTKSDSNEINYLLKFKQSYIVDPTEVLIYLKKAIDEQSKTNILEVFRYSKSIEEFWFEFQIKNFGKVADLDPLIKSKIESVYLSKRSEIDTGKLIYRLHSIGLLKSYTKNYNAKVYNCTFYKNSSIEYYIKNYEEYLKRYQSEFTVSKKIDNLKQLLSFNSENLIDDLVLLLHSLVEFSMYEIATKRRLATNEIQRLMNEAIKIEDFYDQNRYIKEETFYYFNAKYAKPNYKENGKPRSLLDDYKNEYLNHKMDPFDILKKYTSNEIIKNGTEQNNYKHLIGSCKKIIFSLIDSENKRDWLLKLLNAFAMYATNNLSYRYEANDIIEQGFINLFKDVEYHSNNFNLIQDIFELYFNRLIVNIDVNNPSIQDIDLIKNKLLQELQANQIKSLIDELKM